MLKEFLHSELAGKTFGKPRSMVATCTLKKLGIYIQWYLCTGGTFERSDGQILTQIATCKHGEYRYRNIMMGMSMGLWR